MNIPPAMSYSVRRIGLFVAVLGLCTVLLRGVDPIVVLLVATLVSGGLSFVLLAGPREQMARSVAERVRALGRRIDAGAAKEDAALDEADRAEGTDRREARG